MTQNRNSILGFTAIFIALYAILFSGNPRFSTADAERMMADIAEHFSKEASKRNQEAILKYSDVTTHGFAYEKWARIANLSLDWRMPKWQGASRFGVSTATIKLSPDPVRNNQMNMVLADPINVIADSDLIAKMTPASPLLYAVIGASQKSGSGVLHHLALPAHTDIAITEPNHRMILTLAPQSFVDFTLFDDQTHARAIIAANAPTLTNGEDKWRARRAELRYDSLQKTPEVTESKATLTLDQLVFTRSDHTTSPFTLTAGWTTREQHNISGATDAMTITLDQCLLADGNLKLAVNGTLHMDIDDAMYGALEIEINDIQKVTKSNLLASGKESLVLELLDQIMGADIHHRHQIIISVKRDKNGVWMVGKIPLSTLLDKGVLSAFIFNE